MQNLDIVHFSLTISRPFSTLGMATNQAGSPLVGPNNVNVSKTSSRENAVVIAGKTSGR